MVQLGQATIKAQQALSNKFGIPTFNTSGGISTVPTSGKLSKINVGLGSFHSSQALNRAVAMKIQTNAVIKKQIQTINAKNPGIIKPDVITANPNSPPSQKTPSVPKILSKTALSAQQALSDKFGIPTFDLKGGISTVPTSGKFADINVGTGRFKTEDEFVDAVVAKFPSATTQPASVSGGGGGLLDSISSFFNSLFQSSPQDTVTGQSTQSDATGLPDESSKTLDSSLFSGGGGGGASGDITSKTEEKKGFIDSILSDPKKLTLVGLGLITVIVLAGGKRR